VLHLFSGKVDLAALPGDTVDINAALNPTKSLPPTYEMSWSQTTSPIFISGRD
jgi:hypothetical protein